MATFEEIEASAMRLSDSERISLATALLRSLPAGYDQDHGGLAEALRRDAEMDSDPSASISLEELRRTIGR